MAQANLAGALLRWGERVPGLTRLEEAAHAYGEVIEALDPGATPLEWVRAQAGLGAALMALGERGAAGRLEEAVEGLRAAVARTSLQGDAFHWAALHNNLGNALVRLGERDKDPAHFHEAQAAYRQALGGWTRDSAPREWAMLQDNLAGVLAHLAQARRGPDLVAELHLYPTERSGWRGRLATGFQGLCLSGLDPADVGRCTIDVGAQPMAPGERRLARFSFEGGSARAERLRAAGTFYVRDQAILGEATVAASDRGPETAGPAPGAPS
jgi:tetratricopeptide (TPR) repeat protein